MRRRQHRNEMGKCWLCRPTLRRRRYIFVRRSNVLEHRPEPINDAPGNALVIALSKSDALYRAAARKTDLLSEVGKISIEDNVGELFTSLS
jgi:hypothetical protein